MNLYRLAREVGRTFSTTRERTRQIAAKALKNAANGRALRNSLVGQ
jgi:DNA-directed RNA polymerase sigma subunit (sigma70/sigma32)